MNDIKGKRWGSTETSARKKKIKGECGPTKQDRERGLSYPARIGKIYGRGQVVLKVSSHQSPGTTVPRNVTPVGKFGKEVILWQGSFFYL